MDKVTIVSLKEKFNQLIISQLSDVRGSKGTQVTILVL